VSATPSSFIYFGQREREREREERERKREGETFPEVL
jgi:hypothetical protein